MSHNNSTASKFFPVMQSSDARTAGFKSLTKPYLLNHKDESIRMSERRFWDRLCHDLKDCKCVIVEFHNGVELWRHDDELDIDPMTGTKLPRNALKE